MKKIKILLHLLTQKSILRGLTMAQNHQDICLEWDNMSASVVGEEHGISVRDLEKLKGKTQFIHEQLMAQRQRGETSFLHLPYQKPVVSEIQSFVGNIRGKFENYVHVGIGGSSLGPKALHSALNHPFYNLLYHEQRNGRPRIFFPDNIDPDTVQGLLDVIDVEKTLFHIVTKSGGTAETVATFLVFLGKLKEKLGYRFKENLIFTTDPRKGDLRKIAQQEEITTFDIPHGVGGRFSVLTPVGLVSAALSGIDIDELLEGAARMDKLCQEASLQKNPAYLFSVLNYVADTKKGKPMVVMMPYSDALHDLADWFRQLWAESLGKKHSLKGDVIHAGPTPIKALGATDQHSQLQLYIEGPYNKIIVFLEVENFNHQVLIPAELSEWKAFGYLGNQTMNKLISSEKKATERALANNHRPNMTIKIPWLSPFTIGQLLYMLELATAFSGGLYGINPFDQPGVEEGKKMTCQMMGRKD